VAPKLNVCNANEIAYINYMRMQPSTFAIKQHTNYLTCRCDSLHQLLRNETNFYQYEGSDVIVTTHRCSTVSDQTIDLRISIKTRTQSS
jgi:hypothetical protein